ncbi:MAG TPA: hypothetical protein VMJ92_03415, partial [Candidatus Limnocylindrales bacterium]|nr:hypothetical protein [Candidatus Limnocylindrales bacterium]
MTADAEPPPAGFPVRWVARRLPRGIRHAAVAGEVARRARAADVVYTTGMFTRSATGSLLARTPH